MQLIKGKIKGWFLRLLYPAARWHIGIQSHEHGKFILKQPRNVSRADPFPLYINDTLYILFEEFDIDNRKGAILIGELSRNSGLINIKQLIGSEGHYSFPYVFTYQQNIYVLPESEEDEKLCLYAFDSINFSLVLKHTIFDKGKYVDSILFNHNNVWYLNAAKFNSLSGQYEMRLYYSNEMCGEYQEHPMNPLSTDNKLLRNGGGYIENDDILYRVSQNCAHYYGESININQIDVLTTEEYREHTIKNIEGPHSLCFGFHTYNIIRGGYVYDVKLIDWSVNFIFFRFIALLKKVFR